MKSHKKGFILATLISTCLIIASILASASFNATGVFMGNVKTTKVEKRTTIYESDTLSKKEVLIRLKKTISKTLDVEPENIKMQSNFTDDLGADDLDFVELIMAFEEEFNISISDKDADTLTTVQRTYDYLIRKLKIKV